ncbi:hypothetical protein ACUR5C_12960 [Aliikangiella sp. IMCC44653]
MAKTRAQENRTIRQNAQRDQLSAQRHVQLIIENIEKMEGLEHSESSPFNLAKFKAANDQRFRILNKYLPDLKQQETKNDSFLVDLFSL